MIQGEGVLIRVLSEEVDGGNSLSVAVKLSQKLDLLVSRCELAIQDDLPHRNDHHEYWRRGAMQQVGSLSENLRSIHGPCHLEIAAPFKPVAGVEGFCVPA